MKIIECNLIEYENLQYLMNLMALIIVYFHLLENPESKTIYIQCLY